MRKLFGLIIVLAVCGFYANAQNPFLPLWEHIPDGEPYVFEDPDKPGSFRVYIYGSHDNLRTHYCGRDQVVWSASVDNLREWRYDGVIYPRRQAFHTRHSGRCIVCTRCNGMH